MSHQSFLIHQPHNQIHRRGRPCPLSVAPMMDRTDRHHRYMMRLLSKHTLLYTEMVTTGAILFGNKPRHLDFSKEEHPIALQLGGDDPKALAECAKIAQDWGYDEVNLNVGCPSSRVQSGQFGACLMLRPERVADAVSAMKNAVDLPITVKHRIGVDDVDHYDDMHRFVSIVSQAESDGFTVHARKAWLSGLSPKENRTIPPLRYEEVYRLKRDFPHLFIEINGGIVSWEQTREHLTQVDGVMIGRAAYQNPRIFLNADPFIFNTPARFTLDEVIELMAVYVDQWVAQGGRAHYITRHLVHLLSGLPGNKYWRRTLSEKAHLPDFKGETIRKTWLEVKNRQLYAQSRSRSKASLP